MLCWIGAAVIVVTAGYQQTEAQNGTDRSRRCVHLEAGHAAKTIPLQAVPLDLRAAWGIGAFDDDGVQAALEPPSGHALLTLIPVGHPEWDLLAGGLGVRIPRYPAPAVSGDASDAVLVCRLIAPSGNRGEDADSIPRLEHMVGLADDAVDEYHTNRLGRQSQQLEEPSHWGADGQRHRYGLPRLEAGPDLLQMPE